MDAALALPDGLTGLATRPDVTQAARRAAGREDIGRAADEFEAMVLAELLRPMFEGLETDGLFGGGHAELVFRSLLVDEYAKAMSRGGGLGLADNVARELVAIQEGRS